MNNFEYITKDIETFKKFANDVALSLNCDTCHEMGLYCEGASSCEDNFIKYLELEKIEDEPGEVTIEQFTTFIQNLSKVANNINNIEVYTGVNYVRNVYNDWVKEGKKLNVNQKTIIEDKVKSCVSGMEHLKGLDTLLSDFTKENR